MATIYPIKEDLSDIPYSELSVYEALEGLGDNYIIFHSVRWAMRSNKWPTTWKENDYLILNRNLGALVLEVKGGDIEYSGGVFRQINTKTKQVTILDPTRKKDPVSQAINGAYHYRDVIEKIARATDFRRALDDRFPVEVAVCFPSCKVKDQRSSFPLAYREIWTAILDKDSLSNMPTAIRNVFDFYGSHDKVDISDDEFRKIVDSIAMDFDLITAPEARKSELDHAFLRLTQEQMGLLDYISEQRTATIQGVAGTGKTLLAKEAARRFAEEGRKVLVLCFNRFLYIHLKHKYPYENVTYYNIHTLLNEYGDRSEDLSNSEMRADALYSIGWDAFDFDDVIIDEAQDFHNREILFFKDYAELKEGRFFVFYDKNQVVQSNEVPEWIRDSECRLLLTKNCRNTYEIAVTAYNVIDVELNQTIQMANGEKTNLVFVKGDILSKLSVILNTLVGEKYGYEYNDIVILSLKTEEESVLKDVHKLSGIPITREYNKSSVLFTTAKKFKGLESRAIIIIDIDESAFNNEKRKRDFYVACSRATQYLNLVINGDEAKIQSIADAIGGPQYAAKGKIALKTQASIMNL